MRDQLRMLWSIMAGQRLRYGGAVGAILLATVFTFVVPLIGKATIDGAITEAAADDVTVEDAPRLDANSRAILSLVGGSDQLAANLWLAAVAMLALSAFAGVFTYLQGRWAAGACEGICNTLRDRLYDHLQRLPCSYHDQADTGDLVQRCTSDVETLRLFLSVQVVEIGRALIILSVSIPLMLMLDVSMTLVAVALVPVIFLFAVGFFLRVKSRFKAVDEAEGRMTTVLQENLTGIRVVRAFSRQDFERAKFAVPNRDYRDCSYNLVRLLAWYWTSSDLLCLTQMVLALGVGAWWVSQGALTVGTLYAFIAYLTLVLWPVRHMGRILTDMGKAVVALGRMQEILSEKEETDQETVAGEEALLAQLGLSDPPPLREGLGEGGARRQSIPATASKADLQQSTIINHQSSIESERSTDARSTSPSPGRDAPDVASRPPSPSEGEGSRDRAPSVNFKGQLTIKNLSFAHTPNSPPALRGVSMAIPAGGTLAILGPSGSGKSTLMHLLLRLYDFDDGAIELDGIDIRRLPRQLVRSQIGVVMQEPFLFSKSLGENIRHGHTRARDEQITAAAEAACIHDTISGMSSGYDTVIGERGVNLSGGQRQRVAIARALVRDPAVLIFDDALSAVDSRTESMILRALRTRRGKRTTIIIAHRLSAVMHADRIIVLDHGRVAQDGTHEELTNQEGLYRNLWRIQSSLEADLKKQMQEV